MNTLRRFFDDIHAIAESLGNPYSVSNIALRYPTITLKQEDRDALIEALRNYRRNGPRVKKAVQQDFSAAE
jgi:hypothetical protein